MIIMSDNVISQKIPTTNFIGTCPLKISSMQFFVQFFLFSYNYKDNVNTIQSERIMPKRMSDTFEADFLLKQGGGGVQQQKRQRTSCGFPGGMIFFVLFCSLFEDILLTKSEKNNKKRTKKNINDQKIRKS